MAGCSNPGPAVTVTIPKSPECARLYKELEYLKSCYGARRGDPNYNSAYDYNGDGIIDLADLGILSDRLGKAGCL
jgi:hypothetical protein